MSSPPYEMPMDNDLSPPRYPDQMGSPPTPHAQQEPEPQSQNMEEGGGNSRPLKRKESASRSKAWPHFHKYTDNNGLQRGACKYCPAHYAPDMTRNGTSSLINHMKVCKLHPDNLAKYRSHTLHAFTHSTTGADVGGDTRELRTMWKFDQDASRKALTEMIIMDELPFIFVENEGFRKFLKVVCPQFVVPSRSTTTRDCLDLFKSEQEKLKTFFQTSRQMVCLTTDLWTSNQRLSYLCLTAHFIDDNWRLCKRVINFIPCPSHKGDEVGILLEKCLSEWGIKKVFTVTVDNASSNDKTVDFLMGRFANRGMTPVGGKYLHMRCVAHILNLVVRDGLAEVDKAVDRVRAVVKYVRQSPARLDKFKGYVLDEGIQSGKALCLDVPTRWNSTYYMLETAVVYQSAFERYAICDPNFRATFSVGGSHAETGLPTKQDWVACKKMVIVLEQFEALTRKVSGTQYVTSNLFLDEVSDVYGVIKSMIVSDDLALASVAICMKRKFDKYWGTAEKMNMLLFVPVILDPRKKLIYVEHTLTDMYDSEIGLKMTALASECLSHLFNEYKNAFAPPPPHMPTTDLGFQGDSNNNTLSVGEQMRVKQRAQREQALHRRSHMGFGEKTELQKYLDESPEHVASGKVFNILEWWKLLAPRYPILARLARDIFAMPISTVASESVFSTGGRIISDFRSSLTPKTAQALICGQNWLREEPLPSIEEDFQFMSLVENDALP